MTIGPETIESAVGDRLGHQNARHPRIVIRAGVLYQPERSL
jgi:hypothetical protein